MKVEFVDLVGRLRSCGFFGSQKDLSNEELSKQLWQKAAAQFEVGQLEEFFDPKEVELFELSLAQLDEKRVWWKEMECGIVQGNDAYVQILKEFEQLSDGHFCPTNSVEKWETAEGPISLSFECQGKPYNYQPDFKYDWLDSGFIDKLYEIFLKQNFPFQLYAYIGRSDDDWGFYGDDIFIVRATDEEKKRLEEQMKWELMVWA